MKKYKLGLDVGGTKIQVGLVDTNNKIIRSEQVAIHRKTKKEALESIIKSIKPLFSNQVSSIGVGITGLVNPDKGIVASSPNLPKNWKNVPLKSILTKKFKVPVSIDNDANCIALAEAVIGLGKNYKAVLSITLGTGVGAGLVINKKIFHGGYNATEFGHTMISDNSTFEDLVSGPAMIKNYYKRTSQKISSHAIVALAKSGNKIAKSVLTEMSKWLAIGLKNALYSYSPHIIIISGGLSVVSPLIIPALRQAKQNLLFNELKKTIIVRSHLNYNAGVIGAALITNSKKV
ncbi:ROK family protein [Patescibacteria group bacterium]|nr:ROK family protein [Patescibacteria group bacterium]